MFSLIKVASLSTIFHRRRYDYAHWKLKQRKERKKKENRSRKYRDRKFEKFLQLGSPTRDDPDGMTRFQVRFKRKLLSAWQRKGEKEPLKREREKKRDRQVRCTSVNHNGPRETETTVRKREKERGRLCRKTFPIAWKRDRCGRATPFPSTWPSDRDSLHPRGIESPRMKSSACNSFPIGQSISRYERGQWSGRPRAIRVLSGCPLPPLPKEKSLRLLESHSNYSCRRDVPIFV